MNPRRRRQQQALGRELRKGTTIEVLEPEVVIVPKPMIPTVVVPSQAEIRAFENAKSEKGVEFEIIAGEELVEIEEIDIEDIV